MKEERRRKAVCAGHICMDITPAFPQTKSYKRIGEALTSGKLVPVGKTDIHTGGSVGNTGLAMKLLGADVRLMGKVGDDDFGKLVLSRLREYGDGIDTGMAVVPGEVTSYSIIISVPGVDRIILHDTGANNTFGIQDIDFGLVEEAALFHFGYPTVMQKMYADDGKNLTELFRQVKELGTATSMDMALVDEDSEAGHADWERILQKTLPYVDIFAPSVEELAFMIDRPRYYRWIEESCGGDVTEVLTMEDIRALGDKLMGWGAKIVLIKCGARGMYFRTNSAEQIRQVGGGLDEGMAGWENQEHYEKSYRPERVLSGTGAGDTSIAAFLCAILEGCTWQESLKLAAGTGASCVAAYDALSGLKSFGELREKIAAGWEKV